MLRPEKLATLSRVPASEKEMNGHLIVREETKAGQKGQEEGGFRSLYLSLADVLFGHLNLSSKDGYVPLPALKGTF